MTPTPFELKDRLRTEARHRRNQRSASDTAQQSAAIVRAVLASQGYQHAASVALFWPIAGKGEVDLRSLDQQARQDGKAVYYPWVTRDAEPATGFRRLREPDAMVPGRFGTKEPPLTAPVAEPGDIDLIVVPALMATSEGHRLGYGGGYYDRLLARFAPPAHSIVVVFPADVANALPIEAHDRACEVLLTGID
jgi:5-formyltetrahydrofolate cyclo-ligase